ncbi:OLC1v1002357C1 [Oldenlandia corymbosa var. corymbosa]|uniref:OLC1v1002357C1 n=1 Tax=Oldenlandia corymbosa var. corymbosa TaxID=529605 RepID=A0AAV1D7G5_OLDCO|nr:OLC1v1002357C1 [Oldenlandia corymbosa var. corymbosa]
MATWELQRIEHLPLELWELTDVAFFFLKNLDAQKSQIVQNHTVWCFRQPNQDRERWPVAQLYKLLHPFIFFQKQVNYRPQNVITLDKYSMRNRKRSTCKFLVNGSGNKSTRFSE